VEGTVKWYNHTKAYGFIEVEGQKDVFVHRNSLPENTILREGDKIEFEIEESEKGPQAVNIKVL